MQPKFMKYSTNEKQLVQWKLIYKNLSGKQKVKWRKAMHRALKEQIVKLN
jgi:hypothetical protein